MKQRKEAFWTITEKDCVNLERYIRKQIKVCIEESTLMGISPGVQRLLSKRIFDKISAELKEDLINGDYDSDIKEILLK